jgi:hypothetical protein
VQACGSQFVSMLCQKNSIGRECEVTDARIGSEHFNELREMWA